MCDHIGCVSRCSVRCRGNTSLRLSSSAIGPPAATSIGCAAAAAAPREGDNIWLGVRRVELGTGRTLASTKNANEHFGEGLAAIGDKLYQLTWREGAMHEYDAKTLRRLSTKAQPFRGEGWGLAYDEATGLAYGTDGTHRVHVLRPAHDWVALKVLRVTDARLGGMLIEGLNELEMVEGELWANILPLRYHKASPCVARRSRSRG